MIDGGLICVPLNGGDRKQGVATSKKRLLVR